MLIRARHQGMNMMRTRLQCRQPQLIMVTFAWMMNPCNSTPMLRLLLGLRRVPLATSIRCFLAVRDEIEAATAAAQIVSPISAGGLVMPPGTLKDPNHNPGMVVDVFTHGCEYNSTVQPIRIAWDQGTFFNFLEGLQSSARMLQRSRDKWMELSFDMTDPTDTVQAVRSTLRRNSCRTATMWGLILTYSTR